MMKLDFIITEKEFINEFFNLGDIMSPGSSVLTHTINLIRTNKIDFVIVNGENASDDGRGITKEIAEEFFKIVDVITSGNIFGIKRNNRFY